MALFYFAWVDGSATTYSAGSHAINSEDVFAFEITQQEGEFATLRLDLKNPRIGLLNSARKQWAWFSWLNGSTAEPLFFGRLVGVPEELTAEIVRLQFVARPGDYDATKAALADSLKVAPFYDPVWINPQLWADPDSALEARPAFWHVHRTTHAVTASDIITGAGATLSIDGHFYDSLNVTFRQRPANKVVCRAEVRWQNEATGSIDITRPLIDAFLAAGSSQGPSFVTSYTGEGLERTWPKEGARIGAGWRVGVTTLERVDGRAAPQRVFTIRVDEPVFAAFPLWTFRPQMSVVYEVSRSYSEAVSFSFGADVQPLVSDADDDDVIDVSLSSSAINELIDAGDEVALSPLRDSRFRSYFQTDRGKQSVEYLICLCRARLLARARAIDVSFEAPFATLRNLTCDDNITLTDPRLPGGSATGKVIGYTFTLDGDEGQLRANVTFACTIGRGGSVASVGGTPVYADDYAAPGWQAIAGGATAIAGDVSYASFDGAAINDDGVNLASLSVANVIQSLAVVDGQAVQQTALSERTFEDIADAIETLNGVHTQVALSLLPLTGGPFETEIPLTVSDLAIPQTINLEAGAA